MRNLMRSLALLAFVTLVAVLGRTPGALAQDDVSEPPIEGEFSELAELEGIQSAVARYFMMDYESLLATPGALEDMSFPEGLQSVGVVAISFDSSENAEAAFDQFSEDFQSELDMGGTPEAFEPEGFSDNTVALSQTEEDEMLGSTTYAAVFTQQDEYLYLSLVAATGEDVDAGQVAADLTKEMVEADAGDGEGEFHEDGTSSGGLWDKLPATDHEQLQDLPMVSDMQLYPELEGEGDV